MNLPLPPEREPVNAEHVLSRVLAADVSAADVSTQPRRHRFVPVAVATAIGALIAGSVLLGPSGTEETPPAGDPAGPSATGPSATGPAVTSPAGVSVAGQQRRLIARYLDPTGVHISADQLTVDTPSGAVKAGTSQARVRWRATGMRGVLTLRISQAEKDCTGVTDCSQLSESTLAATLVRPRSQNLAVVSYSRIRPDGYLAELALTQRTNERDPRLVTLAFGITPREIDQLLGDTSIRP